MRRAAFRSSATSTAISDTQSRKAAEQSSRGCGATIEYADVPGPTTPAARAAAVLDWSALAREPHKSALEHTRHRLAVRRQELLPRLPARATGGTLLGPTTPPRRVDARRRHAARARRESLCSAFCRAASPRAAHPCLPRHPRSRANGRRGSSAGRTSADAWHRTCSSRR